MSKNKHTGLTDAEWKENGEEYVIACGKCGQEQNIFTSPHEWFIGELDFICCSCGERNTISCY